MNIEEARKIVVAFMAYHELHDSCLDRGNLDGCDIFNDLKTIILNVDKNARREALDSEAVKELVEALEYCQRHGLYGGAKEALYRFAQFKQEGKS